MIKGTKCLSPYFLMRLFAAKTRLSGGISIKFSVSENKKVTRELNKMRELMLFILQKISMRKMCFALQTLDNVRSEHSEETLP